MKLFGLKKNIQAVAVLGAVLVGVLGFTLLSPAQSVFAITDNQAAVCQSIGSGTDCATANTNGGTDVNNVIKVTISIFSGVVGVLAVIMIVVSGFKYITAAGDANKITSAKNTLVYAIVGLVIVVLSQAIVRFVLTKTVTSQCTTGQTIDASGNCIAAPKP